MEKTALFPAEGSGKGYSAPGERTSSFLALVRNLGKKVLFVHA